jgi:hypothetical protein
MRWLFVVAALAGCAPRAASGPAWPKQHFADNDGGESISPRQPKQIAVATPRVDEVKPVAVKATVAPVAVAPGVDAPAATVIAPVVQPTEEMITTEEIIIEIDD